MKKLFITIISVITLLASCDVSDSLNIDQKSPTTVPASGLFANATRNLFDQMNDCNVNTNVLRLYSQYWAQTTYPDESQYNQVTRNISGNIWNTMYRDVLQDLKGAKETLAASNEDDISNKIAIINVVEAYAYATLVETFGDVPYTEALDPLNPSPKYDDAKTVYLDVMSKLSAAISTMDANGGGFDSNQDPVYGGDVSLWKEAASSLLLRMAMRIADSNPTESKQYAEAAAAGAIMDNSDNFGIHYLDASPNTNPLWVNLVQSGRIDFVGADTFIDELNALNDPRRPYWFETVGGVYKGGIYGDANAASSFSGFSSLITNPSLIGNIITASEVHFLLAEAVARGYSVGGTVEDHYNAGITASILEWGGTQAEATAYLAQPAVAYATAAGDWKQKIGTQKWIAMFNNGMEGWTTWRIFDQPAFNAPPGMSLSDIPTRFIYPISEATLNGPSYDAAASAIGGDTKTTKLFFDKF
ncbi:MAG: SusD/RagB family nutrient-binding outer membrane lipoprotein [Flavobacteriaceae bacterium]|nr:SusD/RagB family nutrient-binding outer membrane lipoprotein [Flavobacteriaceae bacterium]